MTTPTPDTHGDRSRSLALAVFAAVEIAALLLWLSLGRTEWFRDDDWDFLAGRSTFDLHDLFADHGTHWKTLPILAYRALWWTFGIRTYLPYLLVVVVLHLTVAALLRVVMRRAGVNPWIATAAASLFALFGAGYGNIVWSFQLGANAAIALGLTQLILLDHDGPLDRRDALGVLAGIGSVMCAGVGVAMVVAATLAALSRRGWRAALVHGGGPAIAYLVWWFAIGRRGFTDRETPLGEILDFIRIGVHHTFGSLGQVTGLGFVLGAVLVGGLVLAWSRLDRATLRVRAAAPVTLLVGALVYLLISAIGRAGLLGADRALEPHYRHVVAALVLPALAIACDALARRWPVTLPLVCLLLVVGIPGNIDTVRDYTRASEPARRADRHLILSLPRTEAAREVPRAVRPVPELIGGLDLTIGWLLDGAASGRIPRPGLVTADDEAIAAFRLSFLQSDEDHGTPTTSCRTLTKPLTRHFERGDEIHFTGGSLRAQPVPGDAPPRAETLYRLAKGTRLRAVRDSFDVVLVPHNAFRPPTICFDDA